MPIIENLAATLGSAVRAFKQARDGQDGHTTARRPLFLDNVTQEGKWQGGTWQPEQDAAALRAMQNSWVYMIIQRKAMEKSAASLYVVDNPSGLPDGGKVIPCHDLLRIWRNPNPHMDGQFLSIFMDWWLDLLGNTYLFTALDEYGRLAELWPLPANKVNPIPGDRERFIDYFEYTANGTVFRIPAEYIYHEMYPNPYDVFRGLAPLVAGMLASDSDSAMAYWNGAFFGQQNVMPSAVISLSSGDPKQPLDPSDVQTFKAQLQDDYAAINRKTAVTNAYDMSVAVLGWNARDMDFLNGRNFTKDEIIQVFGGFSGMFDKNATEANATVADNMFKEKTIWPSLGLRAGRITSHLLRRFYGKSQEARYEDIRPINRQLNMQESAASSGVMLIDERRKRFWNLGPLPNSEGQRLETAAPASPFPTDYSAGAPAPASNPALPTASNALPPSARSLAEELKAWRWRSLKSLEDGRPLTLDFKSLVISPELNAAILDGLEVSQNESDVKSVFALANEKGLIRSWRPWSAFELRLMAETNQVLLAQMDALVAQLRATGSADALSDPLMWATQEQMMRDMLEPVMLDIAASAVKRVESTVSSLSGSTVAVNWGLANENAVAWARQHAGEMISKVTQTTKTAVADQVAQWAQSSEGLDGLIARVRGMAGENGKPIFNSVRAEMIAVTEATNTYAGANSTAWTAAGYAPAAYKPAYHIMCRCYLMPYKLKSGEKVLVNYTARDERVCLQKLTAPWGTVDGCRDLHTVIVSEGQYLGKKISEVE